MPQNIGVENSIVVRLKKYQAMCLFALATLHTIEARDAMSTERRVRKSPALSLVPNTPDPFADLLK